MVSALTNEEIWKIFEQNLAMAGNKLTEIPVYCGSQPEFRGLSGVGCLSKLFAVASRRSFVLLA